jgi:hypothetical protein
MLLLHLRLTVQHFFPSLLDELGLLPDHRIQSSYTVTDLAMAAICMFILKRGSRNAMNEMSQKQTFCYNYQKLFGIDCPHMDAVEDFFRLLPVSGLELIKQRMLQRLLEKKTLHKFRLLGIYHVIAIDGVCISTYTYCPYTCCPKTNTDTWQVKVVEAKLVYSNGFSISVASEFVTNVDGDNKQDCEQKAALRLCKCIKEMFPCLPICIAADGLYTSENIFQLCKDYQWKFIITHKDNCLESVWQEVRVGVLLQYKNKKTIQICNKHKWHQNQWKFVTNIPYHKKFKLNWIECTQSIYNKKTRKDQKNRFVHITNIDVTLKNVIDISNGGRLRWNIENQGFNDQKNHGYNLEHKYSRNNLNARQNYYQCLQIAHAIVQLCIKTKAVQALKGKVTEKNLWLEMLALLLHIEISHKEILDVLCIKCQFRY